MHFVPTATFYNPSAVVLRPMALWVAQLQLTGPDAPSFDESSATLVLEVLRTRMMGTISSYVSLNRFNVQVATPTLASAMLSLSTRALGGWSSPQLQADAWSHGVHEVGS